MTDTGTIVHVVLAQWREDMPSHALEDLRRHIGRFATDIPGVVSVTEGPNVSPEGLGEGFEWGLVMTFASASARDIYLDHPVHMPVVRLIGEWAERGVVFDLAG